MNIATTFPPNYGEIAQHFPVDNSTAIFTYGDTIYNPFKRDITPDIEVHEQVHTKQQGDTPDIWWYKYLKDKEFRLQQELEAYGEQYRFIKDKVHGKLRDWALDNMAFALSGELYGNMIGFGEARSKIRNY